MTDDLDQPADAKGLRRARSVGAAVGLIPAALIALLFAYSGSAAPTAEIAVSLGLVALIAIGAGWLAGPLAGRPRHILVATIGYAIALIATTATLSVVQGAADSLAEHGPDPVALMVAVAGRVAVATAGIAYLIVPALVLGSAWSISMRGLSRLVGEAPR